MIVDIFVTQPLLWAYVFYCLTGVSMVIFCYKASFLAVRPCFCVRDHYAGELRAEAASVSVMPWMFIGINQLAGMEASP